jgi:acetoin utilization protein AcuC
VPRGLNDTEHRWLMERAVLPLIAARRPQAIMVQAGADSLEDDPLAKLSLSNNAYWAAIRAVRPLAPRLVILGGGGYNPYAVGRCWAGIWAVLNDLPVPERLPAAAETVLRGLAYSRAAGRNPPEHWFTTLRDAPREGEVRPEIMELAELTLKETLPA